MPGARSHIQDSIHGPPKKKKGGELWHVYARMHDATHFKFTQLRTWPEATGICYTGTVLCMSHF